MLYFDEQGIATLRSAKQIEGVPYIEGLSFDTAEVEIGKVLPVEDDAIFEKLAETSRYLRKNALSPERIVCNTDGSDVVLYFGAVEVLPGNETSEERPAQVGPILEELKKKKILFVGGGVGAAPVYPQVKWMKEHGVDVDVIIGARTKDIIILENEMRKVAANLYIATDDGSYEFKGNGCDKIYDLFGQGKDYTKVVAIGPMIMMKFVCKLTKELGIPTIVSMNPIMVDGTGMCGACRLKVGDEIKFACVDGPEFDGHLVDFDQAMLRQRMYKTEEGRAMLKLQEGDTHHGGCGQCH